MADLVIAALMTAVVTYGMSASAKLRNAQAYRAFRAGLAATALIGRPLTGPVAATLAAAEVAVAALCATALVMTFLSHPGASAAPVLTVAALAGAAALTIVLTAGVAMAVRRGAVAPCACFGSGSGSPLSGVHLARNAFLLVVLAAGAASVGLAPLAPWPPSLGAAAVAAAVGGVLALLLTRLDDLSALFRPTAR
jgi:hypothetical protein